LQDLNIQQSKAPLSPRLANLRESCSGRLQDLNIQKRIKEK
jgi:hypothetical protein